jgi:hypothetical protein
VTPHRARRLPADAAWRRRGPAIGGGAMDPSLPRAGLANSPPALAGPLEAWHGGTAS